MKKEIILTGENFYNKRKLLKKIKTENINWEIFYLDENSGEKWIEEYPHAELQGGGIPQLRVIEKFPWE